MVSVLVCACVCDVYTYIQYVLVHVYSVGYVGDDCCVCCVVN